MLPSNFFIYLICYLLGSLPSGFIIGKIIAKEDIRNQGSGNIGATNITRIYGRKAGLLTLIADCLKAIVALKVAEIFGASLYLAAFFVIFGHIFPLWLKFRGGKGVATFFASLLYISPLSGFIFALSWLGIFVCFKVSSLSSLASTLIVLLWSVMFSGNSSWSHFILSISILVIFSHRDNIKRMLEGKELKFKEHNEKRD